MAGDGKHIIQKTDDAFRTGNDLRAALEPYGYDVTINSFTGEATITAPDGASVKIQNNGNFFNNGSSNGNGVVSSVIDWLTIPRPGNGINKWFDSALTKDDSYYSYSSADVNKFLEEHPVEKTEAELKAEQEQSQTNAINNSNVAWDKAREALNNIAYANSSYKVTAADRAALKAVFPNYSDEQLTNLIANKDWASNIAGAIEAGKAEDILKGSTLKDYFDTASRANTALTDRAGNAINKTQQALLTQIAKDPELYKNITQQLRGDALANITQGQRVANLQDIVEATNQGYSEAAAKGYDSLVGSDDSVVNALRSGVFNNLVQGYGGYTEQQLNKLATDTNLQTNDIKNLITVLSLVNGGLRAEQSALERAGQDAEAKANAEAILRQSKAEQQAAGSRGQAQASADLAATLAGLAKDLGPNQYNTQVSDISSDLAGLRTSVSGGGSGYNNNLNDIRPEDAPYIDENLYKALLSEDYLKYLNEDTFKQYTTPATEAELAQRYGLTDLLDQARVKDAYVGFQEQANRTAGKAFTDAQRAYIAAIAAGDTKTAEQLTRMANMASTSRKNLYGSSALANQFAQQRNNATAASNMYYDTKDQDAMNRLAITAAEQAGRQQWNAWAGDASTNAAGNSFRKSFNQNYSNTADATKAYGDLVLGAMGNQTHANNTFSSIAGNNLNRLSNYAGRLNSLNGQNAAVNSQINSQKQAILNNMEVQKLINDKTKNSTAKKVVKF